MTSLVHRWEPVHVPMDSPTLDTRYKQTLKGGLTEANPGSQGHVYK